LMSLMDGNVQYILWLIVVLNNNNKMTRINLDCLYLSQLNLSYNEESSSEIKSEEEETMVWPTILRARLHGSVARLIRSVPKEMGIVRDSINIGKKRQLSALEL